MTALQIVKTSLSPEEQEKVKRDLKVLRKFIEFCKNKGSRLIVTGGYGLDGALGQITRPHNDLDIVVYSENSRMKTVTEFIDVIKDLFSDSKISIHSGKFMHTLDLNSSGFGANIYVVQTANNPFADLNSLILKNGEPYKNNPQIFLPPVKAKLRGLKFEAQDPNFHLADIFIKGNRDEKLRKHAQDIENLRKITNQKKVEEILSSLA